MRKILFLALATLVLAGCNTTPVKKAEQAPETQSSSDANTNTLSSSTVSKEQSLSPEQMAHEALKQVGFVIYFDYDKSDIKPEFNSVLTAHAKYLSGNASLKVRLEGNTDERGSREYNIGLGERRAQAVRRALMLQGVPDAQITTLSYGEERPAVEGHDEAAYAKNRRVEIVY